MRRVTLDPELRTKLFNLREPLELCDDSGHVLARVNPIPPFGTGSGSLELCDESGQVLGRFTPITPSENQPWEPPPLSAEELQRRLNEPDYSTQEVIDYLESL